ncbi:MAG: sporulation protein [Oscillospiraceae bacterium]|nr:sporulation protein [Oscillospiraceae bacterium]
MKQKFPILAALCALFLLAAASDTAIERAAYGLRLCWELILPSLFPFFVLSSLLSRLGFPRLAGRKLAPLARRLFHTSGAGVTALLIGLTGGYPLGAAYVAELEERGEIGPGEGGRLLGFCNNSGPAFLVGAIGTGVFGSARAGLLLYLSHALAAVLGGLLLRSRTGPDAPELAPPLSPQPSFPRALSEAVRQSVPALLNVCGFVVFFTVFCGFLDAAGFLDALAARLSHLPGLGEQQARALLLGFWELGGGVGALRGLPLTPGNLALAAALVGWGGVSVQFQTLAVLADSEIKSSPHLAGRLMSAVFGAALAYGLGTLVPIIL